jgi:hypothetical protein
MHGVLAAKPASRTGAQTLLTIEEPFRELFACNQVHTLEEFCALAGSQALDKPTLPSWRTRLAVDLSSQAGRQRLYVKRFDHPPFGGQLRRFLSRHALRTTAGIERHWIRVLDADGIAVPEIAAFAERCRGPWELASAIVLCEVPGQSLEKWFIGHPQRAPRPMQTALAHFIARFHDHEYRHRDLYASHIFLESDNARAARFRLIDLQRVLHRPWRSRRWQVKDLAQLNYSTPRSVATASDRLRWIRNYLGVRRLNHSDHRALIRSIAAKTARIAAHDAKRRQQNAHRRSAP